MKKPASWIVIGIIAVLVTVIGVSRWQLQRARNDARSNALRADSITAWNDSTRAVSDRAKKVLGDSLRGVERRAWQAEIVRDALDKALRRVSAAKANVTVSVRDLRTKDSGTVRTDSGDVRAASFAVDSTPFHVRADVRLPPAPRVGTIDLNVKIDSARIGARVQCGKAEGAGVRPATMTVTTPSWLTARIDSPQFSPDVCNPKKKKTPWLGYGAAAGVGAVLVSIFK